MSTLFPNVAGIAAAAMIRANAVPTFRVNRGFATVTRPLVGLYQIVTSVPYDWNRMLVFPTLTGALPFSIGVLVNLAVPNDTIAVAIEDAIGGQDSDFSITIYQVAV